jgi:Domain of unknown function (DUF5666)
MTFSHLRIGIAALGCLILAACGGESTSTPTSGTTGPTAQNVVVSGAITGFGSVYVNGVRFDTSSATIMQDGARVTQGDLRVGQMVHLQGRVDDSTGRATADSIYQDDDLEGPISAIDTAAQTFVVLGHTVRVTPETSFDDSLGNFASLALGRQVEVSGMPNASGHIVATRIEARAAGETRLEVQGRIALLDTVARKFRVGALVIEYSSATLQDFGSGSLANGQLVEVKGNALNAAGELVATRIELRNHESGSGQFRREIEGLVTRYVSATDFDVAGRRVTTTSTTRYENGTAADLALNVKIEAEGSINADGVLIAAKIEFKRGNNAGLAGIVDSVTPDSASLGGTLSVLGVTITVDNNTRVEDKSDARVESFRLADVRVGDYVRVRGTETTALRLTASRLERRRAESTAWVRGTVRNLASPNLTVLGVPVVTTAATEFEEISAAEFFANAAGRVVKAKGVETANSITAREIEFEDSDD